MGYSSLGAEGRLTVLDDCDFVEGLSYAQSCRCFWLVQIYVSRR